MRTPHVALLALFHFVAVAIAAASATEHPVIPVWPEGRMPGAAAAAPEGPGPNRGDGFTRITNVSRPTLTLLRAQSDRPVPAVIVCPGGGYSYVVVDKEGTEVAAWLNSLGITALVLKYRTPNNRDGALQDVQRALSLVRTRAAEWGIDPRQIGVMGFSAGGNLAAKASTRFRARTYPALDDIDRQGCRPDFAILMYPAYLDQEGRPAADLQLDFSEERSPRAPGEDIPPTLIIHTEDDRPLVNGSKVYSGALQQARVPHTFLLYATGGHGYALRATGDVQAWPAAAAAWLRAQNRVR